MEQTKCNKKNEFLKERVKVLKEISKSIQNTWGNDKK